MVLTAEDVTVELVGGVFGVIMGVYGVYQAY